MYSTKNQSIYITDIPLSEIIRNTQFLLAESEAHVHNKGTKYIINRSPLAQHISQ